ncbi:fatty-acid amide hydrolase 2-B-like isoform X2 [Panulirus ornatus]|uniref:fatty-acid amide hydrolase 2-B-like isoform X2 n=2 Tax=Panulirus ornatus TaxID=150431 RepID=UPI003A87A83E
MKSYMQSECIMWWLVGRVVRLIWPLLQVVRWAWDMWVSVVFFVAVGWRRKSVLPPVFNPALLLSASELAHNIRERKMSSVEVVRSYITRISNINPILNALAQENFQAALLEARRVDERLDQGLRDGSLTKEWIKKNQPFLGVPFTVKETISVAGLPHTGGLLVRTGTAALNNATVVAKMKKAGAIFLANTNVSELGMWWESDNRVYGRTNNPYDTRRTSGGSSGGEGALMCACGTPLSLGTDTGGSIRIPAFFCGIFGHKPTSGVVSIQGCNIHLDKEWSEMQSPGPLTRHAQDLAPILTVLAGENVSKLSLGKHVDLGTLQIFTMENDCNKVLTTSVSSSLVDIQRAVIQHFQHTYDCTVHKVIIPGMRRSFQIWQEKFSEEYGDDTPMFQKLADNKGEINVWTEITRAILGRAHHTLPSLAQAALDKLAGEVKFLKDQKKVFLGKEITPVSRTVIQLETQWKTLQMRLQRLLGETGVLLYPSHSTLAPYHSESFFRPLNFTYTAIFNALGFPATQVPLGLAPNGVPLGVQVVGGLYQDHLTISVAADLERAFGGWVCPSKIL